MELGDGGKAVLAGLGGMGRGCQRGMAIFIEERGSVE